MEEDRHEGGGAMPRVRRSEASLERALAREARRRGGIAVKLAGTGLAGMPDRLVLMPGGRAGFVEMKAPGGRPGPLQLRAHERLRALGFACLVADSPEGIREALDAIQAT